MLDESSRREDPEQDRDVLLGRLVDEYFDRKARGEPVNETELLADHPELADEFKAHIEAVRGLQPATDTIAELIERGLLTPSSDPAYAAQLGRYKVATIVGVGGMGIVLEAYDEDLGRTIALKVLRPEFSRDEVALARFVREAKAAAALRHPNLVTIHAIEQVRGTPYIAMERVNGPSLADVIRKQGPLPTEMIREVFRQLLSGLSAAHEAGLIHRDIKPSNILLDGYPHGPGISTATDKERQAFTVKIADFGLARMMSSQTRMTLPDSVLGTPEYMSPEQARGDDNIDHRTDLYSVGVVLYEMLTGRPPFKADTPTAVIHQILHTEPKHPTLLRHESDRRVSDLALRLMARCPADRPERLHESLLAPVSRGGRRGPPHWRRILKRVAVSLFVLALLCVAMITVVALWPHRVIENARVRLVDDEPTRWVEVKYEGSGDYLPFCEVPEEARNATDAVTVDYNGDNAADLVVVGLYNPIDIDDSSAESLVNLIAYDARDGARAWVYYLHDDRTWPDCNWTGPWRCKHLKALDIDADGNGQELVVSASNIDEYPTLISVFSVDIGGAVSRAEYRHYGHAGPFHIVEKFFSEKYAALVLAAMNNKLDGLNVPGPDDFGRLTQYDWCDRDKVYLWAVIILDPRTLAGEGPPSSERFPPSGVYAYAFLDLPVGTWAEYATDESPEHVRPTWAQTARIAGDTISPEHHSDSKEDGPEFRFLVMREERQEGEVAPRQRAQFVVDRHLNLVKVFPQHKELELPTEASWLPYWRQIIRDGKYVLPGE